MQLVEMFWIASYRLILIAFALVIGAAAFMAHWAIGLAAAYLLGVLLLVTWKPQP